MKFLRQEANYKKRIAKNWRKPKGRHSKLREKRAGLHKMPGIGFGKNKKLKVITNLVYNVNELSAFKKGSEVTFAAGIGAKKKILMLEECVKKGIMVTNYKKINDKIKGLKDSYKEKTDVKKKVVKKKPAPVKPVEEEKKKVVVKKKAVVAEKKESVKPVEEKKKVVVKKKEAMNE
ncbi:MAG: eL32 family ribosomal protein [Candidatus Nanoarchaeia archaeon]|jgi:large subunit ribosomal protein L32e